METYKKAIYRTPNRMLIDTGHKTYDLNCQTASTGNVVSNNQLSFYLRPYNETECNGYNFDAGKLLDYDLNHFTDLPNWIKENILETINPNKMYCLYEFRHWNKSKKYIHGYVLTEVSKCFKKDILVTKYINGKIDKSEKIIDTMTPYISIQPKTKFKLN